MKQLSKEEAINFDSKGMTLIEIFEFQIHQELLCVPFSIFHEATEKALKRSVWTHEFAKPELLIKEYEGKRTTLTDPFSTFNEVTGSLTQ